LGSFHVGCNEAVVLLGYKRIYFVFKLLPSTCGTREILWLMQIPPHLPYHSVGFRRLRRIVNEAYLTSFINSLYPHTLRVDEEWNSRGLSVEDFRVTLKGALAEVVSSREKLASFELLRNVTEEEEEKFLLSLSLKRQGDMVVSKRKRQPSNLHKEATPTQLGQEMLRKMDERVSSFITSNPSVLPIVNEIEVRVLALYPVGGYIVLDTPFELFLARGVAQFYGFISHTRSSSGNDEEPGRFVLFLERGNIDTNKSPPVYLTSILSSNMESAFR